MMYTHMHHLHVSCTRRGTDPQHAGRHSQHAIQALIAA